MKEATPAPTVQKKWKTKISKIYTNVFNYEIMIHVIDVHYYKPPFIFTTTQYTQSKDSILTQPLVMLVSGRCLMELTSNDSSKGLWEEKWKIKADLLVKRLFSTTAVKIGHFKVRAWAVLNRF